MDPAFQFGHLDPANQFAMEGLNMAFARELLLDGKPLPKTLFLDVMVKKTQKLTILNITTLAFHLQQTLEKIQQ